MTEEEWLAEQNRAPWMLMELLGPGKIQRTKVGRRKLRLFACGCSRLVWHLLDEIRRPALETAERFADGEAGKDQLQASFEEVGPILHVMFQRELAGVEAFDAACMVAAACSEKPVEAAFRSTRYHAALAGHSIRALDGAAVLCHLVRDVFGNPFRPVVMKREWIAANDRSVEAVARAIYQDRAFDRMPILGDALEDAGCDDETILAHCRGPGPHVRGCWVVDSILGQSLARL